MIHNALGKFYVETHAATNIALDILRHSTGYYVQYRNALGNSEHADNVDEQENCGGR